MISWTQRMEKRDANASPVTLTALLHCTFAFTQLAQSHSRALLTLAIVYTTATLTPVILSTQNTYTHRALVMLRIATPSRLDRRAQCTISARSFVLSRAITHVLISAKIEMVLLTHCCTLENEIICK